MVAVRSALLAVGGVLVLVLVTYDALRTTVAPAAGAGPLTRWVSSHLWRLARRRSRTPGGRPVVIAGTAILLVTVATWVLLLWAGWWALFSVSDEGVRLSQTGVPASAWDRVYFTGYTLFTLGVGDIVPAAPLWQVLTPLAALHGLFTITLAITYLLPVMSAAVERRQQAATIWGLGGSPTGMVLGAWHEGSLSSLHGSLQSIESGLLTTVERHPTYPVLHYFHSADPRTGFPPRVAALDDAISIVLHAVHPDARPHPAALVSIRRAIDELLRATSDSVAERDVSVPPRPDLRPLVEAGVPLVDDAEIDRAFERLEPRRHRLHAFVVHGGWHWDAVAHEPDTAA